MGKRKPNWLEIEARYKLGDTPATIAADYYCLTAKQISDKAYTNKWIADKVEKKSIRVEKVNEIVQNSYDALQSMLNTLSLRTTKVLLDFTEKLDENKDCVTNPYLFDGEKVNTLYQTTLNNATKLAMQHIKHQHEQAIAAMAAEQERKETEPITITFVEPTMMDGDSAEHSDQSA